MINQAFDRSQGIGCSEIAICMGLSRWSTPLQLWAEKTGKVPPRDLSDIEAVEIGTDLEEYVSRKFSKKTGFALRRDSRTFKHPHYPFIYGHVDRMVVSEDAVFEAKTTSAYRAKEWDNDGIPQEYIVQLNGYLGLTGKSTGYIACLIGGQKFAWKQIAFDAKLYEKMIASGVDFWQNYVLADVAPAAMAEDGDILSQLFSEASDEKVAFEGEDESFVNDLIEQRNGGLEQMKLVKDEVDKLSNQIKQKMERASEGRTGQYKITLREQRVSPFIDTDAMKQDGIYSKYEADNRSRVLRITQSKG